MTLAPTEVAFSSSAPGTSIEYVPFETCPVYVCEPTVSVTVSPSFTSPPTVPVTATVAPASVAFRILSVVIASTSTVAVIAVSTV